MYYELKPRQELKLHPVKPEDMGCLIEGLVIENVTLEEDKRTVVIDLLNDFGHRKRVVIDLAKDDPRAKASGFYILPFDVSV